MIKISETVYIRYPTDVVAVTGNNRGGSIIYLEHGQDDPSTYVIPIDDMTPKEVVDIIDARLKG
jgi:hypothetical protein